MFHFHKGMGKEDTSGRHTSKTGRNTKSVATRVSFKVEQVKRSADTDCNAQMVRRAYNAKQLDNWESFKEECRKEGQLCEWTIERLQEAYDKVALEDIGRLSIAEDILRKSMDFLRRIIAPVDGMGGVTLSCVCPHCNSFSLDDYIWWVSTGHGDGNNREKKHCNWWCAACGGQHESSSLPMPMKRRSSKRTQRLRGEPAECDSPISKHCNRPAPKKQKRHHGWAEKLHPNG